MLKEREGEKKNNRTSAFDQVLSTPLSAVLT